MKESKEFIIDKLTDLHKSFDGLKIRYEYKDYLSLHLIEILPLNIFESNEEYISAEILIQDEFELKFNLSGEEILFVSKDSLNEIEEVYHSWGYNTSIITEKWNRESVLLSFKVENELKESIKYNTSYALAA